MPSEVDIDLLRGFLDETVDAYRFVIAHANIVARERERLSAAIEEFSGRTSQLLEAYRQTDGEDAGVTGKQLRAKVELASFAKQKVTRDPKKYVPAKKHIPVRAVRHWVKRVKILVGSLKTLIPGAEALAELLDLLDSSLDR